MVLILATSQAYVNTNHNNCLCVLLPHHSPEVVYSLWEGSLGSNISPLFAITVEVVSVNVIRPRYALYRRQVHSAVIIRDNVVVTILESVLLCQSSIPSEV